MEKCTRDKYKREFEDWLRTQDWFAENLLAPSEPVTPLNTRTYFFELTEYSWQAWIKQAERIEKLIDEMADY